MDLAASLAERSILAFGAVLFFGQILGYEIGFRFGRRDKSRKAIQAETVGVVVAGMLGLLAFVLALTLTFATTRYTERRMGALAEANAIGTAWLRAKAIGDARSMEIAKLLEEYVTVRAQFVAAGRDTAVLDDLNARTNALQSQMWGHLSAIVREDTSPVSASLMGSLNDAFDASTAERFAFELRLPHQISWLLIGMTLICMACLGYQFGLRERHLRLLVALLTLMWTSVIVDILDLASARIGQFKTQTDVYEWTARGFAGGVTIPPLPK